MERLNWNDFVPHAPSENGEQIHINHDNCPAGQDTRQRLYIKRTDDGQRILAYCHNCSQSGSYRDNSFTNFSYGKRNHTTVAGTSSVCQHSSKGKYLPRDAETTIGEWPPQARLWIKRYGITQKEVNDNGLFYSSSYKRVGLPTWVNGNLAGVQYRRVFEEDRRPKYFGYGSAVATIHHTHSNHNNPTTIIIVEDKLSAIKCSRIVDACCLNGADLDDKIFLEIYRNYSKIYVFMDDDNAAIKMKQIAINNKFSDWGRECKIIRHSRQPKELGENELRGLLT